MKKVYLILLLFIFYTEAFSQTIKITVNNELEFGELVQTQISDIPKTSSDAAKYTIVSDKKRHVYVDLILPSVFKSGTNSVSVTFDQNHSGWSKTNNPATSTSFNPHQQLHVQVTQKDAPFYIWLGGILNSNTNTVPGLYTGTITVKVTY